MKRVFLFALLLTNLVHVNTYAQEKNTQETIIHIDENTVFKDEKKNSISQEKAIELIESGEWDIVPVIDASGKRLYLKLVHTKNLKLVHIKNLLPDENSKLLIGKKVPESLLEALQNQSKTLENTTGKVIVVNFWFVACKPCINELPELNSVYQEYKNNPNVIFTSITFDSKDKVKAFKKRHQINYPVVSDAKHICDLFEIKAYPTNIVIDKNGHYLDYVEGGYPGIGKQISSAIKIALANN